MSSSLTRVVLATQNPGKVVEFQEALGASCITLVSAADVGISTFPPETGSSYEENALIKAAHVALTAGVVAISDDSGIEVAALGGEPGVHSARFGGPGLGDGERTALLLKRLRDTRSADRSAKFVSVIMLATPSGTVRSFRGECTGTVLAGPAGSSGFGYDPIFYSDELGKSFAEATLQEKRSVSHRGRALVAFAEWLATADAEGVLTDLTPKTLNYE